ncbi:hypothetical protein Naga_100429g1 [Nannochloropsis gaditana]|uniref:Uncharacterized protein n=1 Tax=Nannochloropsis gaditana TaxID=72520 RepID=W7T2C0_9STRA|nr:hypothetical protein Naga_100429g1 [Nannochloropsis gaditana]
MFVETDSAPRSRAATCVRLGPLPVSQIISLRAYMTCWPTVASPRHLLSFKRHYWQLLLRRLPFFPSLLDQELDNGPRESYSVRASLRVRRTDMHLLDWQAF